MTDEEIATLQSTNEELVARVNQLESINTDLVGQKKDLKQQLQDGMTDTEAKAEIDNLKALLEGAEGERSELETQHTGQINGMRMKDLLREAGIKAQNDDAMGALSSLMLEGVSYDEGFKWLNEDGTTRYNEAKKPYGIIDRVNELKDGDKSYLFAPVTGGGSGDKTPVAPDTKPNINDVINAGLTY